MTRIEKKYDIFLWSLIYMLPLIILILFFDRNTLTSFSDVFTMLNLDIVNNNVIYSALVTLFGVNSNVIPIFTNNDILLYLSYFILMNFVHIIVDIILVLPRWCHKLIDGGFKQC